MVLGTAALMGALPGSAGAQGNEQSAPSTSVVSGNPTCEELGYEFGFKIDDIQEIPAVGTFTDPDTDFEVTISDVVAGNPVTFDFSANIPVAAVLVKAGPGGIVYTFDPPSTTGNDLASDRDSVSHIDFCWNEDGKVTTSSTEHDESTTSSSDKATTSSSEKDKETTTSVAHESTTTVGDEATTTTAGGVTTTAKPDGELPRTGSTTFPLVALGAVLLAGGLGLLVTTRLRRS